MAKSAPRRGPRASRRSASREEVVYRSGVRRKLIEVALPLAAINAASAREKSIRHGHPSTLHLWWARRPLAAARAVIFAQMVDDPSEYVDVLLSDPAKKRAGQRELKKRRSKDRETASASPTAADDRQELADIMAELERERLFGILRELVKWENTTNEDLLEQARAEIWQSWRRACAENADHPRAKDVFDRHKLPAFHDPFAGGGALPLEAQRLGLEAHASDLNPVAVLINKAMIEIPPKFAGRAPVSPDFRDLAATGAAAGRGTGKRRRVQTKIDSEQWRGASGLAEDVRFYGRWMREEARKRVGHLYPQVAVTPETVQERPDLKQYQGRSLTVIAWLWARTVKSPNPAFADVEVPLASTWMLSTKKGKEAWVEPVIEGRGYRFAVRPGAPPDLATAKAGTKLSRGANFRCLLSGTPMSAEHIKAEGQAKRMGSKLMAVVAEGDRGRVYLTPSTEQEDTARKALAGWQPDQSLPDDPRNFWTVQYGLEKYADLFTPRQLVALTTFSDLVGEATERVRVDAAAAGLPDDGQPLRDGGTGATAYAEAVGVYLGLTLSRFADRNNSLCTWDSGPVGTRASTGGSARTASLRNLFARQAIPMVWDYGEANPFSDSGGGYNSALAWIEPAIRLLLGFVPGAAFVRHAGAHDSSKERVVSTDPPYYDNIGYADLSDFFYVWLRRSLGALYPDLFATMAVPKAEELVASPYRHGSKQQAEQFFLEGMTQAMKRLGKQAHPGFPTTIYYAFKQSERKGGTGITRTGWETFLDAVIRSGLAVTGTWPMRTELSNRMISMGTNALASSIVLVCRPRSADAPLATRREFLSALRAELPLAVHLLQTGHVAPVDLAQAAIGPGMAVYTRYARVLDASGEPVPVREALALINQVLDEVLAEQEGEFDADSRWALAWFEEHGFAEGDYGVAETLSKAKNTAVAGMVEAGILDSRGGKVRLLTPKELPDTWDPITDERLTTWEAVHHLIRVLESAGEQGAADLVAKLGGMADTARELCYRLYTVSERQKRAAAALSYNGLVQSWPEIKRLAQSREPEPEPEQMEF